MDESSKEQAEIEEGLRLGFAMEAAMQAGIERMRAESFAKGLSVVVEIDGETLLEGPEGHFRPVPDDDRRLTREDFEFAKEPSQNDGRRK